MEPTIEEKIALKGEIDKYTKILKYLLADLDSSKKEFETLEQMKKDKVVEIHKLSDEFTKLTNDISSERLSWTTEKANDLKEIDDKKDAVLAVLVRSKELDDQQDKIEKEKEEVFALIDKNAAILKKIEEADFEGKKARFKEGVAKVISELSQI